MYCFLLFCHLLHNWKLATRLYFRCGVRCLRTPIPQDELLTTILVWIINNIFIWFLTSTVHSTVSTQPHMRLTAPRPNNFILTLLPACLTLLLFFYLWTISHRPPIPEKAKIENRMSVRNVQSLMLAQTYFGLAHRWGFPEWYGKGPTPYDLESGLSVQKQRSILLFIGKSKRVWIWSRTNNT